MIKTNKLLSLVVALASSATISFTALAADNMQSQSVNATKSATTARACIKAPSTSAKPSVASGVYTPEFGGCGKRPPKPKSNPTINKLCFAGLCFTTAN